MFQFYSLYFVDKVYRQFFCVHKCGHFTKISLNYKQQKLLSRVKCNKQPDGCKQENVVAKLTEISKSRFNVVEQFH